VCFSPPVIFSRLKAAGGGAAAEAEPVPMDLSVDLESLSETDLKVRKKPGLRRGVFRVWIAVAGSLLAEKPTSRLEVESLLCTVCIFVVFARALHCCRGWCR